MTAPASTPAEQLQAAAELAQQWLAGDHHPLEVEVGSGKGLFIANASQAQPDRYFIGIELADKYAAAAQAKLQRLGRERAVVMCGDAGQLFREKIADQRLAAVHVYFPDPWWKRRHKKRRVLNETMLQQIERTLRAGGELHFWTDVLDYYDETLGLIGAATRLDGPYFVDETPAQHTLDYRTHFERRTRMAGLPVYRALFRR
jgi:tRNA (guanine-N7-)-methyltransferase